MKTVFLIFTILFVSNQVHSQNPVNGTYNRGFVGNGFVSVSSNTGAEKYAVALDRAAQMVNAAILDREGQKSRSEIHAQLNSSHIYISTTPEAEAQCGDRYLFVNSNFPNRIFVCEKYHKKFLARNDENALHAVAQALIHEAAHLAVDANECDATKFEIDVMETTVGIQSRANINKYMAYCKETWARQQFANK